MQRWLYLLYLNFLLLVNHIQMVSCRVRRWLIDLQFPKEMRGRDTSRTFVGLYASWLQFLCETNPGQSIDFYCDSLRDYLIENSLYKLVNRNEFRQIAESILIDLKTKDFQEIVLQDVKDLNYANRILNQEPRHED